MQAYGELFDFFLLSATNSTYLYSKSAEELNPLHSGHTLGYERSLSYSRLKMYW